MRTIKVDLEHWDGTPVIGALKTTAIRSAQDFLDRPASLTARQGVFYRNLIKIAEATGSRELPVEFLLPDGSRARMDHGCMKIAEHAGFIEPLKNGPSGYVETIRLSWLVKPENK